MFKDLTIEGFRCFKRFEMHGLTRVNLLVGKNNSGKTTVLEALELLANPSLPTAAEICHRRGFHFNAQPRLETIGLFTKSGAHVEEKFVVESGNRRVWGEMVPTGLEIGHGDQPNATATTESGWFDQDAVTLLRDQRRVLFLESTSLAPREIAKLADQIQLSSEERYATEALRVVEPSLVEYRPRAVPKPNGSASDRSPIIVRLEGNPGPMPLASLGEGAWKLLSLALSLANARDMLLIDDIDTGLHYSVMVKMWRMVLESAERLNLQIFATTHSRDCIDALAVLAAEEHEGQRIGIHRIERENTESIAFSEEEIIAAAEHGIEVR